MGENSTISIIPKVIRDAVAAKGLNDDNANILLPTKTFGDVLGEFDRITFEVIKIDPNPKNKEVYEPNGEGKGFALAKRPLEMISAACAIIWDPRTTTNLESSARKSRAKATGAIRKANGEWFPVTAEKTVDLDAIEEEQRLKAEEKADKDGGPIIAWEGPEGHKKPKFGKWKDQAERQAAIDMSVRKSMVTYRKFKDERAETGAMERCIKKLLALKDIYTYEELSKPFAFPRIVLDVGKMLENPQMRAAALDRMTGSVRAVFGPDVGENAIDVTPERKALTAEPAQGETEELDEDPFHEEQPAAEAARTVNAQTGEMIGSATEKDQGNLFEAEEPSKSGGPPWEESPEAKIKRLREQLYLALNNPLLPKDFAEGGRKWLANNTDSKNPDKLAETIASVDKRIAALKAKKAQGAA